ncbi:MAG: alkaline serine protease, partial [Caldilineae bacterium]
MQVQDTGEALEAKASYVDEDGVVDVSIYAPQPKPFVQQVDADALHAQGIDGSGVTIAVIDTGLWTHPALLANSRGEIRVLARYNAIMDAMEPIHGPGGDTDGSGHGSHVASLAVGSRISNGLYDGIAPNANLVSVKAFDDTGMGSYLDVIRGIDWVVAHKDQYNIRVLNLSFSSPPQSYYWDDPLNQAVMRAWQAGIVVVAAAGNKGPDPMSVGVPGNVPYIITVGAMTDNYTPNDPTDDSISTFSSAGPTVEGFVKPDVVAPGA